MNELAKAGEFRHRVVIETPTRSTDTSGVTTSTWATLSSRWCAIKPLSGSEQLSNDGLHGEITHEVKMRYYSALTAKHRIKFGSRYFSILSVRTLYEGKQITMADCREIVV